MTAGPVNPPSSPASPPGTSPPRRALVIWASVTLILSVVPISTPGPDIFVPKDILAHAAFYLPLGALFLWTFPQGPKPIAWARASLAAALFGFGLEIVQLFIPYRDFAWSDVAADL